MIVILALLDILHSMDLLILRVNWNFLPQSKIWQNVKNIVKLLMAVNCSNIPKKVCPVRSTTTSIKWVNTRRGI